MNGNHTRQHLHQTLGGGCSTRSAPQVIEDAVRDRAGRLAVVHRAPGTPEEQRVTIFDTAGRVVLTRTPPERLRFLVEASASRVLALGASGKLVEVGL